MKLCSTVSLVKISVSVSTRRLVPVKNCQPRLATLADRKKSHFPSNTHHGAFSLLENRTIFNGHLCQTLPYPTEQRLLSSSARSLRPNLKSTFGYLSPSAFVALLVLAAWVTVEFCKLTSSDRTSVETMPSHAIAPGRIGNLTAEQDEKLRKLWDEILKLCGVANGGVNGSGNADAPSTISPPALEDTESPHKKRFSLFRRKTTFDSKSSNGYNSSEVKNGTDANDKHGQTKQYRKALENLKPETIRETIWSMVKQDNPDALVLRFLRARKWDVQQALIMLVSAMSWRHTEMHVDSDIMKNGEAGAVQDEQNGNAQAKKLASDFMAQSRQGKCFLHGTDKEGRPICVVRVRLHNPSAQSAESLERFTVFVIETTRLTLQPPVDTAVSHSSPRHMGRIMAN